MAEQKCEQCKQSVRNVCDACEQPLVSPTTHIIGYAVLALVVVFVVAYMPFYFYGGFPKMVNSFGDSFGFANAVVSACAFAALVMTMFWQKQELEQQRYEIRQMREANQESAQAQKDSHEALRSAYEIASLEALRKATNGVAGDQSAPISARLRSQLFRNFIEELLVEKLSEQGQIKKFAWGHFPACQKLLQILDDLEATEVFSDNFKGNKTSQAYFSKLDKRLCEVQAKANEAENMIRNQGIDNAIILNALLELKQKILAFHKDNSNVPNILSLMLEFEHSSRLFFEWLRFPDAFAFDEDKNKMD